MNAGSRGVNRVVVGMLLPAGLVLLAGTAWAEVLTLPADLRPAWLARDGIVMAGSWEPLLFRVRRDGSEGYTPTAEQRAAYEREHSRSMIERLKGLGANFVMMHCYKGAGLEAEADSMADAVRFARLCHQAGLRVGVYNYSGAFLWDLFYKEVPAAGDWVLLDERHRPITYGRDAYRFYWNRNHPDAVRFYRQLVRFAVQDLRADLIHFDNYHYSAGFDPRSVENFRTYLHQRFSAEELARAGLNADAALPPDPAAPPSLLTCAWRDFECDYLARSYLDMCRYARTLRPDVLIECNPMSVARYIRPPVDHARILPGGEAFWDESRPSGCRDGKLTSRIRSYKVGRLMDNLVFSYITTPLEAAESMAFNHPDCLGCVCWFEYADVVAKPGSNEDMSPEMGPYIRFYHRRRNLLRDANVVADAAVLRSFASQVLADPAHRKIAASVEDRLMADRVGFQIVYDRHLADLNRWPVLVLAGCVALSDRQIEQIAQYVRGGGKLCLVGPAATHDEWLRPRDRAAWQDLPAGAAARIEQPDEVADAVRGLRGDDLYATVEAAGPLCIEIADQKNRRLLHLVNYNPTTPIERVCVRLRLPPGRKPIRVLMADPRREKDAEIPFDESGGAIRFVLPKITVYAVAAVELK